MTRFFKRVPDLGGVISRFPIPAALMAIFTLIIVVIDPRPFEEPLGRLLIGLIISGYVTFCMIIVDETRGSSRYLWLQISSSLAICALAWFSKSLNINLFMGTGAVLLALGNMVLWRQSRNDLHVWDFTHKIWTGAVFATVGSILFLIGVLAIQFALKSLFGLRIDRVMERLVLPVGFGFLAPLYWLATAPTVNEDCSELEDKPSFISKAVAFFGTWLLSPLTLIYAFILVAYAVKIVLMRELPNGEIAGITTPFLIIGTLTWLVLEPPFIRKKFLARAFRKFWFFLSIPAALLLAVSVFIRISNYGLTPERFALVLAVIWALGIGLWFTVGPKEKRDIRFIPGFASLLFLIGTFSAEGLSLSSQAKRLEANLMLSVLVTDANVISSGTINNKKSAQTVKSTINYLLNQNGDKKLERIMRKYGYEGALERTVIFETLGIKNLQLPNRYQKHFDRKSYNGDNSPVNVSGYTTLLGPYSVYFSGSNNYNIVKTSDYSLRTKDRKIELYRGNKLLERFDVDNWIENLTVYPLNDTVFQLKSPKLDIYEDETAMISLHIISVNQNIYEGESKNLDISFFLLIKEK